MAIDVFVTPGDPCRACGATTYVGLQAGSATTICPRCDLAPWGDEPQRLACQDAVTTCEDRPGDGRFHDLDQDMAGYGSENAKRSELGGSRPMPE